MQYAMSPSLATRRVGATRPAAPCVARTGPASYLRPCQHVRSSAAAEPRNHEREAGVSSPPEPTPAQSAPSVSQRYLNRRREQIAYQVAAVAASSGVTALAVVATYYRFSWHMRVDSAFPWLEFALTLALVGGGVIGMELWARFAHKSLWHDFAPGWALHKSHHQPRLGPFEDNDVFAVINAVPAIGLCLYGFFTPNLLGGVCFGTGLGITLFGIMYMFIHDGLVHRRFPVGPIAELPYLKRVAAAHKVHHSNKYDGVPWGLFLGPQELEEVGGKADLDRLVSEMELSTRLR